MVRSNSQHLLSKAVVLACLLAAVAGQGLPVQFGLLPTGDLTTVDQDGPYAVPGVQAIEVSAALAAKTGAPGGPFTDADVLNFLANTECLEATFNTFAAFGAGLPESLKPGAVAGGKRAPLSPEVQSWAEEVALDEQGHVRMVRQVLGERSVPCPALDLAGGFRAYFDAANNVTSNPPFDPFKNDINFLLATWSLEEIGATGDKGCILLASNPGVSNCIAGLAGAASYQSGVDRHLLWQRRNETVPEYNLTVHQIVEAVSNIRDTWDGPAEVDQPLYNGNPNFIAVPSGNINLVPTDLRGLTFSRTPQQVLRIVTLGSETGKGGFFPEGLNGKINSPVGFNDTANPWGGYEGNQVVVRSLAEANRTVLLNANVTNVTAAPLPVQAEASGQQYSTSDVTPSDSTAPSVTLIGSATASSPAPASNGSTAANSTSAPESGAANAGGNATMGGGNDTSSGNATGIILIPIPVGTDNTTTSASPSPMPSPGMDNTTSGSPSLLPSPGMDNTSASPSLLPSPGMDNTTTGSSPLPSPSMENTTTGSSSSGNTTAGGDMASAGNITGSGSGNNTVVVPITTALNQTSTNISTSPEPAFTSTSDNSTAASPSPALEGTGTGSGNNSTSSSGVIAPISSPAVAVLNATGTEASPSPTLDTGGAVVITTSPAPAGSEASPAPSPGPNSAVISVAVTNLTQGNAANVTQAVTNAAETASNGNAETVVGSSPAPAGGARKLRRFLW